MRQTVVILPCFADARSGCTISASIVVTVSSALSGLVESQSCPDHSYRMSSQHRVVVMVAFTMLCIIEHELCQTFILEMQKATHLRTCERRVLIE